MNAHDYVASLVGRPAHQTCVARDEVTSAAIRTWCDAMGERNPVYLDRDAARAAGHDDVIAPPAMLQVWTMPGLEPDRPLTAGPAREGDLDETARRDLAELGYSGTLAAVVEQQFDAPLRVGDRVVATDEYISVSEEKRTQLGPGFFLTSRIEYTTVDGRSIGALTASVFHFAPAPPAALVAPFPMPDVAPRRPERAEAVALTQGVAFGPVAVPLTPTQIVAGALATRDFYPVHHDRDFARAHGNTDFLMNILTTNGIIARIVGEWTAQAPLLTMRTRLIAPAYANDQLSVTGTVDELDERCAAITVRAALRSGAHAEVAVRVGR